MNPFENPENLTRARESLSRIYSSKCTAHGTYILTIAILAFAFVEILQFVQLSWLLIILIVSALLVAGFIMLIRMIYWGILSTIVLWVKPYSIKKASKNPSLAFWRQRNQAEITALIRLQLAATEVFEYHKTLNILRSYSKKNMVIVIPSLYLICALLLTALSILLSIHGLVI